jgi:uncharacterized protein (TIGR02453 family)
VVADAVVIGFVPSEYLVNGQSEFVPICYQKQSVPTIVKKRCSVSFSIETFRFLEELAANNQREWFADNKGRYLSDVQAPALALIAAVEKPLRKVAPFLVASTAKSGSSLMRIYRDTRFAKDKTPYKTNIGIQFRHEAGKDVHAPGVYLHIAADECFLGAGCYRPEPSSLAKFRAAIASDGKAWIKARDDRAFNAVFKLWGESLKTTPRDYPKDHPLIDDLRRKDFIGLSELSRQQILSDELVETIITRTKAAKSLMRFLCEAVGVPYS